MTRVNTGCPNCGGHQFKLEKKSNRWICLYCETAIPTQEGNDSDIRKSKNCLMLANQAFSFGNYLEAYEYYMKSLEYCGDNYWSIFRKGHCAALLSSKRMKEFVHAAKNAYVLLEKEEKWNEKYIEMTEEMLNFVRDKYSDLEKRKAEYLVRIPTQNDILNYYDDIRILMELFDCCMIATLNELIEEYPDIDEFVRKNIKYIIGICENGCEKLRCYTGCKHVENDLGEMITEEQYKEYQPQYREEMNEFRNRFKDRHNHMPSISRTLENYDNEIKTHENNINVYKNEEKKYFDEHPDIKRKYESNNAKLCIIATGMLGLFAFLYDFRYGIIRMIFVLLTLYCCYKSYEEYQYEKQEKMLIIESLPGYLKILKKNYDESNDILPIIRQERKKYVSLNLII